jgi:iron complex transport system permease protein
MQIAIEKPFALKPASYSIFFVILLFALILLIGSSGAVPISITDIPSLIFGQNLTEDEQLYRTVLIDIRLPRILLSIIVGAGLAISGCTMQALFRNPLAEPGLLGISSGAALGAVMAIVLGFSGLYAVSISAFIGALIAIICAWQLGQRFSQIAGLLLAGIAINAIAGSLTGLLTYFASDDELRSLTFWSMGSVASANWNTIALLSPVVLILSLLILRDWRALNALLLGERESLHLGFNLPVLKRRLVILVALLVGVIVAACGTIGFVGLVVPHLVRMMLGPNHRTLLPFSFLVGAILLLLADWLARLVVSPAELPIGVVTSLIGGPFFMFLLFRRRGGE